MCGKDCLPYRSPIGYLPRPHPANLTRCPSASWMRQLANANSIPTACWQAACRCDGPTLIQPLGIPPLFHFARAKIWAGARSGAGRCQRNHPLTGWLFLLRVLTKQRPTKTSVLLDSFDVMVTFTEGLPVGHVPKRFLVASVRFDVIHHGGRCDPILTIALGTKRVVRQKYRTSPLPPGAITAR